MFRSIFLLLCAVPVTSGFGVYCHHHTGPSKRAIKMMPSTEENTITMQPNNNIVNDDSRRSLLLGTIAVPSTLLFWAIQTRPSFAAPKLRPDDAYASLVRAREELRTAGRTYLPKKDWEGLRTYLDNDATNMNNYELNAQALLESKRLDAESKKDIGTIRRYGVGADVIIMYGGLKAEVSGDNEEEVNYAEIEKYLRRTTESLEEVLAICRSNGFP